MICKCPYTFDQSIKYVSQNRRKTQGKFTTNPTQYMQFKNLIKYMHVIEGENIVIINRSTQDVKAIFNYEELYRYLEVNNLDSDILNMYNN